jgi:hypothetical protein
MVFQKWWVIKYGCMSELPKNMYEISAADYRKYIEVDLDYESEEDGPVRRASSATPAATRPHGRLTADPKPPAKPAVKKAKVAKKAKAAEDSCEEEEEDDDEEQPELIPLDIDDTAAEMKMGTGKVLEPKPFVQGGQGRPGFDRWRDMGPFQIFIGLMKAMLAWVVYCTNTVIKADPKGQEVTVGEFYIFVGIHLYMASVRLHSIEAYWYPKMHAEIVTLMPLAERMTFNRFKYIKECLRYNDYDAVTPEQQKKDPAWKIRPCLDLLKAAYMAIMNPGMRLAIDESMVRITGAFFSLRRHQPRKPTNTGALFYTLVDVETKICVNIDLDDGTTNPASCRGMPWKATGEKVLMLLRWLPGCCYHLFTDNYYTGIALAEELLSHYQIYLVGTIQRGRTHCPELERTLGKTKGLKPTALIPKGTWNYASNRDQSITIHAYMDSAGVCLLDTLQGISGGPMWRQSGADHVEFFAPCALSTYNAYMNGVDVWDQMRSGRHHAIEELGRNAKWTTILFLSFVSMSAANAYNIYRAFHKEGQAGYLTHADFQIQLFLGLWNNELFKVEKAGRPHGRPVNLGASGHHSRQLPEGSRKGTPWAYRACCKYCGDGVTTSWYCTLCEVFLCPDCHGPYHDVVPFKRPNRNPKIAELK